MPLSAFVLAHRDEILARWEARARALPAARALSRPALRDDVPAILEGVAAALEDRGQPAGAGRRHGHARAVEGFRIDEVIAELACLRDATLEVRGEAGPMTVDEATRLARAFDPAVAAAVGELAVELAGAVGARREATAQIESLFESAPVGLAFWDRDLRFVRLNRRLAEMNGLPVEAHLGRTPAELFPGLEGIEGILARWRRILETGEPWIGADVAGHTAAASARRVWREDFYPVRAGGEIVGLGAVVLDVTEERRAEERLRFLARASHELAESMEQDGALARIARLSVPAFADWCAVVVTHAGQVRRVAVEAADPAGAALAREMLERYPIDPARPAGLGAVLATGRPQHLAEVGEAFFASLAPPAAALVRRMGLRSYLAVPLTAHGKTIGAMSFGITSSPRRFGEDDLAFAGELAARCAVALENARLFAEARAEARLREQVLAIVSHDLRNPLQTVVMNAARIDRGAGGDGEGARARRAAEAIRRAADRMQRLIGDLLDATALETGRFSVRPAPEPAAPIVREAVEPLRAAAREKGAVLHLELPGDLPPVRADHDRVAQVVGNLVANAIAAVDEGGRVSVRAERRGDEVVLSVVDDGRGIPAPEQERLFEPFRRGAEAGYRGTGLGLAIARGIVEAHGGRIWLESRVGEGTTFSFALPVAIADGSVAREPGREHGTGHGDPQPPQGDVS